jgi:flagella basal body P-ring formation protein FlgA
VLLFPAVNTFLVVAVACISIVLSSCYSYRTIVPIQDIPAGAVIRDSDLRGTRIIRTLLPDDYATDRAQVIGHRALKMLRGGSDILQSDISPFVETAK